MQISIDEISTGVLIDQLNFKQELKDKILKDLQKSQQCLFKAKKIEDVVKPLYREGVECSPDNVKGFIYLSNFEKLQDPVLTIFESHWVLEFNEIKNHQTVFPEKTRGCHNFTNRGFINTEDSSLFKPNARASLKGISSFTLGVNQRTFAPYDGSQSGVYKHLNLVLNNQSLYVHLANHSELEAEILMSLQAIYGKPYVQSLQDYLSHPAPEITEVDGYSKQITVPFNNGYVLVSPVFNHHNLQVFSRLRYEKGKLIDLNEKFLGGTKPGNVSYTNLLGGGALNQFKMPFPKESAANQRALYVLATKGHLVLSELRGLLNQAAKVMSNSEIPKLQREKMAQQSSWLLLQFAVSQVEMLWLNQENFPIKPALLQIFQGIFAPKSKGLGKADVMAFWQELILQSMRNQDYAKACLTEQFVTALKEEVTRYA
ncbi:hypothetical protein [Thiomicrorhabdus indica]|uniref:hypothetical protein n=1 Tax=Thiomicrorhabdus indica TaxID=2267253 RepID=UPI00102DC130|nr:hypothetical protein [Thiomicrorhabdus indica]